MLEKNSEVSKIVPELIPSVNQFDESSTVFISQIKISNSFLYEVLSGVNVSLIHVDKWGYVRAVKRFTINDKKTEYIINTKLSLNDGAKGEVYLLSHDHHFEDN